jgi:hypothetical protein
LFPRLGAESASGAGGDKDGGEVHAGRQAQGTGQVNRWRKFPGQGGLRAGDSDRKLTSWIVGEDLSQLAGNLLR